MTAFADAPVASVELEDLAANLRGLLGRWPKAPTSVTARAVNDLMWLERVRSFAMTAIVQYRETRDQLGRGRYSLWTGDIGLAVYLWDCLTAEPKFPTIDVF